MNTVRRWPGMAGTGLVLLAALVLTGGVRTWMVNRVQTTADARQQAIVDETLTTIENRFASLRERVQGRAKALATDSVVIQGLQTWDEKGTRSRALVQRVLDAPLGANMAVEVYTPLPRPLVWNGRRMPLGGAPDEDAFLQRPQTGIISDGEVRQALVVWWPVERDERVVGAVRVVQTLRYRPPVKNRYVQGFSVQDEWERATGESIRLTWSPSSRPSLLPHRPLQGVDGEVLGWASVVPPSPARLTDRTASFYNDLLVLWAALLVGWGVGVVALWYLHLAGRPGVSRYPGARAAATGRFFVAAVGWIGARYLFLDLDVPGRWMEHVPLFSALFDPTRFASTIGGGIFRSIGDLFLTGLWAALLATGTLHLGLRYRLRAASTQALFDRLRAWSPSHPSLGWFFGTILGGVGLTVGSILSLAYVVRRAVLDSTLNFFSRTGLLPDPLLFVVLCALLLLVVAVVLFGVACTWIGLRLLLRHQPQWPQGLVPYSVAVLFAVGVAAPYLLADAQALLPFPYPLVMVGGIGAAAVYGMVGRHGGAEALTIRGLLLGLLGVTLLFYPLLYGGMDAQRRDRMVEAARSFEEGYDPRALYSIQQVLRAADTDLAPILADAPSLDPQRRDSIATRLVRQSLLASLTTYEVSLTLFGPNGTLRQRYGSSGRQPLRAGPSRADRAALRTLQQLREQASASGPFVTRLDNERGDGRLGDRFQYAGLLWSEGSDETDGYGILLRAEPRSLLPGTGPGVPRVLLPDGSFSDLYAELSLAEFRGGTLVRNFGTDFGRTQLPDAVRGAVREGAPIWRTESLRDRSYLTYYHRSSEGATASTVAVRIPSLLAFDHLYYMLRLTVAGLGVGLLVYLLGLYGRYRYGLVPAQRVRFRNKVLNAFLIVGIVSMVAVGVVGVRVVTGENERIVERQLRDQLTRVEETLALEARPGEPLWQVAERMDVDSLAARVGLDLRMYEDGQMVGTSRPRLVRDGLVDERLSGPVYHMLYDEAYRFTTAEATLGTFRYRVGYQTLADEQGVPRLVVGVPTLAQQEQVAEEQARTLAYLFGALLMLVVVVMLTAVVLANALAQPIARLRQGLEAVGEGRFAETLPVNTRDEVGDLVRTFNEMRAQLAESRRKLAQQEREMAWREMARQVAHEIKNPLTPMKLSIQHLRRAFKREHVEDDSSFADLFDRITTTLIEQIEALVRIADEFSTFARLPTRVLETLDLNEVIREAVRLMDQEQMDQEATDCIELKLHPAPLPIEADREELRRIYINLIKNALQAIPDDQTGHVEIATAGGGDEEPGEPKAYSWIIDNGTGIPTDVQDKIFEPNFSTKTGGTGLGLAIAKKSVDELGGDIGYDTTEGEGTTFWMELPLSKEAMEERRLSGDG